MRDPQPIATAPTNGTTILTDRGVARYAPYHDCDPGWFSCTPEGDVFTCADEGYMTCSPTVWIPLPEWMS